MDQREDLYDAKMRKPVSVEDFGPGGEANYAAYLAAQPKPDALYPGYIQFSHKEVGLLQVGMVAAGLVAQGARPLPRTMEMLLAERVAMRTLTQRLIAVGDGLPPPADDDPVARSEAFDAKGVRHKAFADVRTCWRGSAPGRRPTRSWPMSRCSTTPRSPFE